MRNILFVSILTACSLGSPYAVPITYTEQAIASGSFGGTAFSDALMTIVLIGDTSSVTLDAAIYHNIGPATVTVAGIGSATFTDQMDAFCNVSGTGAGGISDVTLNVLVLVTNGLQPSSCTLGTVSGTVSGTTTFNSLLHYPTTNGSLFFTAIGISSFTATAVPEPGSLALLGIGLSCLIAVRRSEIGTLR